MNRMLDEGANFTISTMRTPASLMKPMQNIRLKLPVIAMDGAVLYDVNENAYLKVYVISNAMSLKVFSLIEKQGIPNFANVIIEDMLVIYYQETDDMAQKQLIKEMRRSPYRNYVKSEKLDTEITERLKVLKYDSVDYPGYSYLKIYNRNATRENMSEYLKNMLNLKKNGHFRKHSGTV